MTATKREQPRRYDVKAFTNPIYLDHVEGDGRLLFEQIVAMDLGGIICKQKDSPHNVTEKPSRHWIKVKNPCYSQLEGREEMFERGESGTSTVWRYTSAEILAFGFYCEFQIRE